MSKEGFIILEGTVENLLPESKFIIKLQEADQTVVAHLSGKMLQNRIKVLPGDKVKLEISPYDLTKGRIVYRFK